jgi:hypothetical protein
VLSRNAGIPHSTLHSFLNGSDPQPRVRRLLAVHYLQQVTEGRSGLDAADSASALAVLTRGIDGPERNEALGIILRAVHEAYHTAYLAAPAWLAAANP